MNLIHTTTDQAYRLHLIEVFAYIWGFVIFNWWIISRMAKGIILILWSIGSRYGRVIFEMVDNRISLLCIIVWSEGVEDFLFMLTLMHSWIDTLEPCIPGMLTFNCWQKTWDSSLWWSRSKLKWWTTKIWVRIILNRWDLI